jgi:hypothetical protein
VEIVVPGVGRGLECRFCVAAYGFRAEDVDQLYRTRKDFEAHLAQFHPPGASE